VQKWVQQLEGQLADKRCQLREASNRYRTLRHQRHSLLTRIKATSSTGGTPLATSCNARGERSMAPATAPTAAAAAAGTHMHATNACGAAHAHAPAAATVNSHPHSGVVPTRAGHGGNFFTEYDEVPRPISSFAHCAGICYEDIAPFMPPHFSRASDPNTISAAISAYQHHVCTEASTPLSEICWFNLMKHKVSPTLRVSHSAGASPFSHLLFAPGLVHTLLCVYFCTAYKILCCWI
jgi:hypothetical protein